MAGWVSGMIERYPWVGRLIGGLALGVGLVTVAFAAWAGAIWVANAAMLANPIGLVVAAVVGAAAIIYSLWDPITEKVGALWDKVKELGETLKDIGEAMKNSVIGKAVRKLFGVEVAEDEALPGQAATTAGGRRGYRSAGSSATVAGRRNRVRGGIGRTATALVVAIPVAAAAPAATVPATVPPPVAAATPAPDFTAERAEAAQIGASFEAARRAAATPAPSGDGFDLAALRADVGRLTAATVPATVPPPVAAATPAPDFTAERAEAAQIGASFEAARRAAATPAPSGDGFDLAALRADVGRLTAALETDAASVPDAPVATTPAGDAPAALAPSVAAPREVSLVFHQTFSFQGVGPDVADEVTRQMEVVMRRASVEAGLAESDDAF